MSQQAANVIEKNDKVLERQQQQQGCCLFHLQQRENKYHEKVE